MWWLASIAVMFWQTQPPKSPEAVLFGNIQAKVAENLSHLPDYTCSETIERFKASKPGGKLERVDIVRLEVAYIGGHELFGWPGSHKIDNPEIGKFVGGGAWGNGDFAILPRNVFLLPGAKFFYGGETELDGKRAVRYNYRVPESAKRLRVQTVLGDAVVGFEGSFLADPVTLDLIRLSYAADDIPEKLGLKSTVSVLDYSRVPVGDSTFLLPKGSELHLVDSDGVENRNRTIFHGCHQYTGQSVIKYGSMPTDAAVPLAAPRPEVTLPEEFLVEIGLDTPIDSESAAIGDPIRALLKHSVTLKHGVVIPKGAVLTGNIIHMETQNGATLLDLQFTSLEFDGRDLDLSGRDNKVSRIKIRNGKRLTPFWGPMLFATSHLKVSRGVSFEFRSRAL